MQPDPDPWWKRGVLYQVYLRSFADSDGDGVGDLNGVSGHLDYLEWLGVAGIWLSPVTPSPDVDWGYDVADYCAVHPELGTMDDLDRLIAEASSRGIEVLLDLVPNHTSARHPWFVDARRSIDAPHRQWYVWADPEPDGSPPNNWVSSFGGPAWTLDETTGQYYLHNHLPEQPDLNWWNGDVRAEFDRIVRFWLDRGVAGFRIDVCNIIVKDAELRDNPPSTEHDGLDEQLFGQRFVYNANRPELHQVLRQWRAVTDDYDQRKGPERVLIGETPTPLGELARFYGSGRDELHLAFNFPFLTAPLEAGALRAIVEETERRLPDGAWPAWTASNHDMGRFPTRWAGDDPGRTRVALFMVLTLRGTAVLYQGDELGMGEQVVERDDLRDPLGVRFYPHYPGRDGMRTPVPWIDAPGGGFTVAGVRPWLPLGDLTGNVADQRADGSSLLHLARDLIALRRTRPDLGCGGYASLPGPEGAWVWCRGRRTVVAVNLSGGELEVGTGRGRVIIGTDRRRDGTAAGERCLLQPWEGVAVEPG